MSNFKIVDKVKEPTQEQIERYQLIFGMKPDEMNEYLEMNLRACFQPTVEKTRTWLMTCMLSDVQEMIERDYKEEARQLINRVKYLARAEITES